MPTVGARIRRARKRAGYTQGDLAAELGVTRGTVSEWEMDRALPRQGVAVRISECLGMPRHSLNPLTGVPSAIEDNGLVAEISWDVVEDLALGNEPRDVRQAVNPALPPDDYKQGDYYMNVVDSSMSPLFRKLDRFRMRTTLDPWPSTPHSPCDVVAWIKDKKLAVLRRFVPRPSGEAFELMPLSDDYPSESSVPGNRIIIVGVVIVHLRRAFQQNCD